MRFLRRLDVLLGITVSILSLIGYNVSSLNVFNNDSIDKISESKPNNQIQNQQISAASSGYNQVESKSDYEQPTTAVNAPNQEIQIVQEPNDNIIVAENTESTNTEINYPIREYDFDGKLVAADLNAGPPSQDNFQNLLLPIKNANKEDRLNMVVYLLEETKCINADQALKIAKNLRPFDIPKYVESICCFVIDIENLPAITQYGISTDIPNIQKTITNEKKYRKAIVR